MACLGVRTSTSTPNRPRARLHRDLPEKPDADYRAFLHDAGIAEWEMIRGIIEQIRPNAALVGTSPPGFVATMALSETQAGRHPDGGVGVASTRSGLPPITQIAFSTCCAHYPGGSIRSFGWLNDALPHRAFSESLWPSLNEGQVGIHNFPFEACSSFTRVTACGFARPPYVDFVTRLPSRRFPSETARQLSSHTDNSWSGTSTHW